MICLSSYGRFTSRADTCWQAASTWRLNCAVTIQNAPGNHGIGNHKSTTSREVNSRHFGAVGAGESRTVIPLGAPIGSLTRGS